MFNLLLATAGPVVVVGGVGWAAKTLVYRHADNYQATAREVAAEPARTDHNDLVQAR
jgi:hypothetical protein